MKNIALAAALLALSGTALAQSYVQGNVGYSKYDVKADDFKLKDSAPALRIAYGQDQGTLRYAVDYTYFGKLEKNLASQAPNGNKEAARVQLTAHSIGGSAFYDFNVASVPALTPYVGGHLSTNFLKGENNYTEHTSTGALVESGKIEESKTRIGAGVVAGAQYRFSPNLALDAGVEYNYLGKLDDAKVNQYGATVGVRYDF